MMNKAPDEITVADLEVVVMPNGEVISGGNTVGWVSKLGRFITPHNEQCRHTTLVHEMKRVVCELRKNHSGPHRDGMFVWMV